MDKHLVFLLLVPQVVVVGEFMLLLLVELVDLEGAGERLKVQDFLVVAESLDKVTLGEPLLLPAKTATYPAEVAVGLVVLVVQGLLGKVVMVV
jgi:hypothetical protein